MNDFNIEDSDPVTFTSNCWARELAETQGVVSFVSDYTDEEIRQSVIQDILSFTMWEINFKKSLSLDFNELTRYCMPDTVMRVKQALVHPDVAGLISSFNNQLRIRDDRIIRQAAMDYCGVYYTGYEMPEDVMIINRDAIQDAVKKYGSLENVATALTMDFLATDKPSTKRPS